MPAKVNLFADEQRDKPLNVITLTEVVAPEGQESLLEGEARQIFGVNAGTTTLRTLSVHLVDEGRDNVQLARDEGDEPGVWAAPGESVSISTEPIRAGGTFSFWIRGVFAPDDAEDEREFRLSFKGISGR
jgi:hypothetical protein